MSTQEHHTTISGLGFTVKSDYLPFINEYPGDWTYTGPEPAPDNYWLVTFDGKGHPIPGRLSPQQMLDWGEARGWYCAYVAPYGRHIIGAEDEVQLHDWLLQRKQKHKHDHDEHHVQ